MAVFNNILAGSSGQTTGAGGYEIERSLRFNSADSAYLSKNFGSAGNRKTWTWAGWVKKSGLGSAQLLFARHTASNDAGFDALYFNSSDILVHSGWTSTYFNTTQVFRDPSAWLHVVWVVDVTQSTGSNRNKLYINGSLISDYSAYNDLTENADRPINDAALHKIGGRGDALNLNGYLADVHFIDGQALDPTSFGEFDDNGVWQPIEYSGSYNVGVGAVNGFHLDFADNSSAAALGTDTSGAGNTWTVNNLSIGGIAYSSYGSGTVSGTRTFDKAFDGSTSTFCEPADNQTITFDFTSLPGGGIAVSSSLRMYLNKAGTPAAADFTVNGTNLGGSLPSGNWLTISGVSSLQTITFFHNSGTSSVELYAVEVDGTTLVDGSPAGNDSLVDSPTNYGTDSGAGGEVRGNYCTWNPLAKGANVSLSNGNLDASTSTTSGYGTVLGTVGMSSGKWYWEFTGGTGTLGVGLGIAEGSKNLATYLGTDVGYEYYSENGNKYSSAGGAAYGSSWGSGDVIGVTFDADAGTLSFYKNGVSQGTAYTGLTNTPYFPAVADSSGTNVLNGFANFGQRPFAYTAPSGFKALCTTNLAEPTIADGSTAFEVITYQGNGTTQTLPNTDPTTSPQDPLNFSPDFVWIKSRGTTRSHRILDTIRGATVELSANETGAEYSGPNGLTAFNSNGFSLGTDVGFNDNNVAFAAWTWDGGSSTVSNTDGSITSSVRANASAGFSVVTYTSNSSSNQTVGHGLNAAPHLVLVKNRDDGGDPWAVYTKVTGKDKYLYLNTTASAQPLSEYWGSAEPTSTVFGVGAGLSNNRGTDDMVAYCFAPVEGYSAFGSYTGNGSATDGPFVYTGFKPRWILIKKSTNANNNCGWHIYDSARDPSNTAYRFQVAESPFYENRASNNTGDVFTYYVDLVSNGFKLRHSSFNLNNSGDTYIYAAFAEHPFQYARAR